ncbi:MAG: trypsin-like serine protease [Bacteroidota bacterium]
MSSLKNLGIAIIFVHGFLSCNSNQNSINEKKTVLDPIKFGKEFISVCKVGIKGGDGTLIEKNWVLTAGHVAEGMFKRSNADLSVYFENGSEYKVKNVFLHPKFEPMGIYDIALLELEHEVKEVVPTKIYTDTNELNQMIILAGHGDKKQADGTWIKDGKLRAYTNMIDQINETHIVFDYDAPENNPTKNEGTSGPGDSGGPAFIKKENTCFVAGISSMGEPGKNGPATYGAIEHFVRVSKFQNWITETMKNANPAHLLSLKESPSNNPSEDADFPMTEQGKAAKRIVDALENYSDEKMIDAISKSFDESVLNKRSGSQIIQNMPVLIKELQNSNFKKIISESTDKISILMIKDKTEYALDIFFVETSKKIEQMGFANLN